MPLLLAHIDAIARQKQRDVLFLEFKNAERPHAQPFEEIESRKRILEWLEGEGIPWLMCGDIADTSMMRSYAGQIYIDVPYDIENATYQSVQAFLENPDGSMRFDDVKFWILSLERAMENAHHDEPGFWERWAEDF